MKASEGNRIKEQTLEKLFLTGPGQDLVPKLLLSLSSVAGFKKLFGPYKPGSDQQRWADYQRFDWSIRQLPAINVFESQAEDKQSDQAYLNGTVTMQVFWPPNLRRSELTRIPAAFKGAVQNFFSSHSVTRMLDELYSHQRPEKVAGLNELGKNLNWSPNTEGLIESELVPVTILDIRYRIDLRSWYRTLEYEGRTKDQPFEVTLAELTGFDSEYQGLEKADIKIQIRDSIKVNPQSGEE